MDKHENRNNYKRKISNSYVDEPPSKVDEVYWIYASRKKGVYPIPDPELSGKWLIFVDKDSIDNTWKLIRLATENGYLGGSSKVATAKENPNARDKNIKVICVYTYNWVDEKDVFRIRRQLKNIGIIQKLPYKADKETMDKKYSKDGHKRISKYYK